MNRRADEVKKRIADRKKKLGSVQPKEIQPKMRTFLSDEERYGSTDFSMYEYTPSNQERHPLFNKEWFMFKVLASACLVLLVAILFKNPSPTFEQARHVVQSTMEKEFQFATVSNWYEQTFGQPLALIPQKSKKQTEQSVNSGYAMPVSSSKVLETFEKNGQGMTVETNVDSVVEVMNEGFVQFVGTKEGLGKTVVVQHADGTETWYAQLKKINVNIYDFVDKGTDLGVVATNESGDKGVFYFAIKNGEEFIDPSQVISVE
ncbi:M23 family metallopeptidase [Metabacillus iocasae]|uniref:Stage IV sporulation protein FA n=1 Tax=Priestia iocasae TaxID=2291674 RepID=A0ABS2QPI4_9BACI|nr:M23 family metallopeptidase [Metabacillus iocasae]MBM7701370.1 stage IV sporulation protein FA [Metabacillus iocasae]